METTIIKTEDAPTPIGPYSQAVLKNNTLYVSGQIAIDPKTGDLVTGDIRQETKRVMENIKSILKKADMDFTNVVKSSIFISDMSNFGDVNEVYSAYFGANPPARETIQAVLPKNMNVEISVIAVQ